VNEVEKLVLFIQETKLESWNNKPLILEELLQNECFVSKHLGNYEGCLLVKEISPNIFECNFLAARNLKALVEVAKLFRLKYPKGFVKVARRKGKQVLYKKSIVDKILSRYVKKSI